MQKGVIHYPMFRQDEDLAGHFAISKCGHDAGEGYVIISAAGDDLRVANGRNRTIQNPKRKNRAHLYVSKQVVPGIKLLLSGEPVHSNFKLAGYIREFQKGR